MDPRRASTRAPYHLVPQWPTTPLAASLVHSGQRASGYNRLLNCIAASQHCQTPLLLHPRISRAAELHTMLSLTRPLDVPTPTTTPESWSDYDYYVVGL